MPRLLRAAAGLAAGLGLAVILTVAAPAEDNSYAEDRAEIENLLARYIFALDFADADAYAGVFTEDGVLDWARGEIVGRQAIHDFIASGVYNPARDAEAADWPAASRHFVTNSVIKIEGDKATALSYWFQATNPTASRREMVLGMFGTWEDKLVKVDGEWLLERHAIYNEGIPNRNKAGTENPAW